MKYIEAPEEYAGNEKSLFIAGGISECVDWQKDLVELLSIADLVVLNPRRKQFFESESAVKEQIEWEYRHLKKADMISFWFTSETLCPITLYELGKCSMTNKPLFVGADAKYARRENMVIQTKLARPDVLIVSSIADLAEQILQKVKVTR